MKTYTQSINHAWAYISVVFCISACLISLGLCSYLGYDMISKNYYLYKGKPIWVAFIILLIISLSTGYITYKLALKPSIGITSIPPWFISIFGILFLIGQIFVYLSTNNYWFIIEGIVISIAMVLLPYNIHKHKNA